jgi:GAF domain
MHVADLQIEEAEFPQGSALARRWGYRTVLNVPLMRDRVALGSISLRRTEVKAFTERQIALLQTFADQAVIAIENVRLFTELQENNRALTEAHAQVTDALDQQTATSEILRVISQSPTDVQPVFDTIARSAVTLCDALGGNVQRFDGEFMHLVANHNWAPADLARRRLPIRPTRNRGAHAADRARSYCELHCSASCSSTASADATNRHRYATRRQLRCVSARSPGSSWINGQNVGVELRTGRFGQRDQIPDLVSEILALKVDVIVAGSPLVITALKQATTTAGGGMRGAFSAECPPFQRHFRSFIPIIGLNHECSQLGECQVADRDVGNTRGTWFSSSPVPTIAGGTADQ